MRARRHVVAATVSLTGLVLGPLAVPPAAADVDRHRGVVSERALDTTLHFVDGEVRSIAQVGSKVVVGGTFTKVGPAIRGAAAPVDLSGKAFKGSFPGVVGAVFAAASDGAGGWYLGGDFASIGGVARTNVAHVNADGAVTSWAPNANGPVYALVATSSGVYVGGDFTTVGGGPAARLARLDRSTGARVWGGAVNRAVRALALSDDGARLYAGGEFTTVDGVDTRRLMAVSAASGVRDAGFSPGPVNGTVRALESRGTRLWLAGEFTTVGAAARLRVGDVDGVTGAVGSFATGANAVVFDIALDPAGTTLFVGGRFTDVGGVARSRVAAVSTGGTVQPLNVAGISGDVLSLALDGSTGLHIAGAFIVRPERSQPSVMARVDLATGALSAVVAYQALPQSLARPPVTGTTGVYALARSGGDLLVGGDFSDYGIVDRPRLAAYDLASGALDLGFAPDPDADVFTVKGSAQGDAVFVGGEFTRIGGEAHRNIAKVRLDTGRAVSTFTASASAFVKDLAVRPDGGALYVGGGFEQMNGVAMPKLAALDPTTGALQADFQLPLTEPTNDGTEGGVRALALSPDGRTLVVVGNFRRIGGQDRPLIAQVDVSRSPATVTAWRTTLFDQPCSRGWIGWMRDVDIAPDNSTIYVVTSGHFYYPACDTVNAFPMQPGTQPGGDVRPLWTTKIGDTLESVAATGDAVYIGGHFRYIETETRTQSRFQLAALDPQTGAALNWAPNADGFRGVMALESEPAGLFLGSDGDTVGGVPHGRMALFTSPKPGIDLRKLPDQPWLAAPGGTVRFTVSVNNTFLDRPVTLTSLTDERLGSLSGRGTCRLPQTIAAGGTYSCAVDDTVSGASLDEVRSTTTAVATDGATTVSDADWSLIQLLTAAPNLRLRASVSPLTVQFPQADVRMNVTIMNLDLTRSSTVTSLTSPQYGDLSAQCGLPAVLGPNRLLSCGLTRPIGGPVGSRPSVGFTASANYPTGTVTGSASLSVTVSPPPAGTKAVLVVASPAAPSTTDAVLRNRLARDYTVELADDDTVSAATVEGAALAVVSASAVEKKIGSRLVGTARPVLVLENAFFDEMLMSGAAAGDQGKASATTMDVVGYLHPLAAALSGTVKMQKSEWSVGWARPARSAEVVAQLAPGQVTEFAYHRGAALADGSAAAGCRVAFPGLSGAISKWTARTSAWPLFDRAVAYTAADCGRGMLWTVAGGPATYPGDGRPATAAGLNSPMGIAFDASGAMYVADTTTHAVRRVGSDGLMTTVAGTGVAGFSGDGGKATAAQLNAPTRIAFDAAGNLYIADSENNRIRRVSPAGTITTVAGDGTPSFGGDGGPATAAKLRQPYDVAVGADGSLYIADRYNHRIRRVNAAGIITTVAGQSAAGYNGDGIPATSARLYYPSGVAVDRAGSIYIADYYNERVRRVSADGLITTVAGNGLATANGDGGLATDAGLHKPIHVLLGPAGDLFISEFNNNRLRRVDANGVIETYAGTGTFGFSGDGGSPAFSTWQRPAAAAFGPGGTLYVVDRYNRRVRAIARS